MATRTDIASAIQARVGNAFSSWRIGLTHDLEERRRYWRDTKREDITHWAAWQADSLTDAEAIESTFINAGMKGGTGGDLSHNKIVYVYIF